MALKSMTGFARAAGALAPWRWTWEVKAVNARGLDIRIRVPQGFDALEAPARSRLAAALARGTCYANLAGTRENPTPEIRINESALAAVTAALARLPASPGIAPASMDGLLALRGMVDIAEAGDSEEALAAIHAAMLASLDEAIAAFLAMRASEGLAMGEVLERRLDDIAALVARAEDCPGRKADAIRARLQATINELASASSALDPARLHQEALLLAAKADVREEIDRLVAHIAAARVLLASGEPSGRKLDFLAQELARESNTLCAKSNDRELTSIGMDLRAAVEQFREQVQNIE
jgi:uncharacterized protein (TIGR00255 family)